MDGDMGQKCLHFLGAHVLGVTIVVKVEKVV
jgi:hypothetical protein